MVTDYAQFIDTYGFPMVACGVLVYAVAFLYKEISKVRAEIMQITEAHKAEVDKLSNALDNNTKVMEKLLDKMGEKV